MLLYHFFIKDATSDIDRHAAVHLTKWFCSWDSFLRTLTLYDSAFYKGSTRETDRKIPPHTNEIVLLTSGLTCDFAGFPPERAVVTGDTFVSRPPARKQSSQR
jgi:hypothetical protein